MSITASPTITRQQCIRASLQRSSKQRSKKAQRAGVDRFVIEQMDLAARSLDGNEYNDYSNFSSSANTGVSTTVIVTSLSPGPIYSVKHDLPSSKLRDLRIDLSGQAQQSWIHYASLRN